MIEVLKTKLAFKKVSKELLFTLFQSVIYTMCMCFMVDFKNSFFRYKFAYFCYTVIFMRVNEYAKLFCILCYYAHFMVARGHTCVKE